MKIGNRFAVGDMIVWNTGILGLPKTGHEGDRLFLVGAVGETTYTLVGISDKQSIDAPRWYIDAHYKLLLPEAPVGRPP